MEYGTWIKDFEGTHSITEVGVIYRHNSNEVAVVSQCNHNQGYLYVTLTRQGKQYNKLVHRLLAETFIPNPENKKYVNHKDCNKQNNSLSNLEWVTSSENNLHSYANNRNKHVKQIVQLTTEGVLVAVHKGIKEAQEAVGHPGKKNIACCLRLERCKTAYGYVWQYLNEETRTEESIKPSKV